VLGAEDFDSEKVFKATEYFVYCVALKMHLWIKRIVQSPKGQFL